MHKSEIKILCLLALAIAFGIADLFSGNHLEELFLQNQSLQISKNTLARVEKSISGAPLANVVCNGGAPVVNYRDFLGRIAQSIAIGEVFFRESSINNDTPDSASRIMEIKFSAVSEQQIYDFLDAICKQCPGIIEFQQLEIIKKNDSELLVKIKCVFHTIDKKILEIVSVPPKEKHRVAPFHIFQSARRTETLSHSLHCAIANTKAFVDDRWLTLKDHIGDFKIIKINHNSIELGRAQQSILVRVGETFNF
ncbi:MAG: hypothetical protein LBJ16_00030 [Holosporaceae bacterium]|jgi:hypothetical protein|nr:hypothetical protein [Holosporaceae bacterium]